MRDAQSCEVLIGANVFEKHQQTGTTTDNRGYFSLKVQTPCTLTFSYVGFANREIVMKAVSDTLISVTMQTENKLNEVTVTATRHKNYEVTRLSAKILAHSGHGGKPDVIKALQLLPGVQTKAKA